MNPEITHRLARRRRRRLLFASASLGLYLIYALQWIFDVRGWIENDQVSVYFPILLFSLLIVLMCALELVHFYIEDHKHDHDDENRASGDGGGATGHSEASDAGGDRG